MGTEIRGRGNTTIIDDHKNNVATRYVFVLTVLLPLQSPSLIPPPLGSLF